MLQDLCLFSVQDLVNISDFTTVHFGEDEYYRDIWFLLQVPRFCLYHVFVCTTFLFLVIACFAGVANSVDDSICR